MRDEAGAGRVAAGDEAAPNVRIGPEGFAGLGVEYSKVRIANRRATVIVGNGIFIDGTGFVDGASLAAGIDDVAGFWRRR